MESNKQIEIANKLIEYTGTNIFLTGKAGTGKTTFLKKLKEESSKRMVVLAATGVAAINAGGMTIHSFLQIPPQLFIPDGGPIHQKRDAKQYSKKKLNLIRSIDLLVIDEISMVRADLLDAVDDALRFARHNKKPFGGVQLLLIGDLQQLAPVVKDEEWEILKNYYDTPYFFSSKALKESRYLPIELQKVYRQSDPKFIDILNKVRDNNIDHQVLEVLNSRYIPLEDISSKNNPIILTTHNNKANNINEKRLNELSSPPFTFEAEVTGIFPESMYPTSKSLELKKGAQVMFIKNDTSKDKRYFNGKIGIITKLNQDEIEVLCNEEKDPISVSPEEWTNCHFELDPKNNEIIEIIDGKFVQIPLKTAWAITIHKSQGLTFDHAIIDASASFSHGQVYVALSRCRSLEGMTLSSKIKTTSIINDKKINNFVEEIQHMQPSYEEVDNLQKRYYIEMAQELFDFSSINKKISQLYDISKTTLIIYDESFEKRFKEYIAYFYNNITLIGEKFGKQLDTLINKSSDYENDHTINERFLKGIDYFLKEFNDAYSSIINQLDNLEIDNKEKQARFSAIYEELDREFKSKIFIFQYCQNGYSLKKYLYARAISTIDNELEKSRALKNKNVNIAKDKFLTALSDWRMDKSSKLGIEANKITKQKTLKNLSQYLPTNIKELARVPNLGKVFIQKYGNDIIDFIKSNFTKKEIEEHRSKTLLEEDKNPSLLTDDKDLPTHMITYNLYQAGKSISEIAKERNMNESTIANHLSMFVSTGELTLEEFVEENKIKNIIASYQKFKNENKLKPIKEDLGDDYSYDEIRMVVDYIQNHIDKI